MIDSFTKTLLSSRTITRATGNNLILGFDSPSLPVAVNHETEQELEAHSKLDCRSETARHRLMRWAMPGGR